MTYQAFSSSQLSRKPAEVFEAARNGEAVIQLKRTNGEVIEEFFLTPCVTTVEDGYDIVRDSKGKLISVTNHMGK
jgi:hypothetical protein